MLRKFLADHEINCPDRTVTCPYCGDTMRSSHYEHFHLTMTPGCQRYPRKCRNGCEDKVTDEQWPSHKQICPKQSVPCILSEQGCSDFVPRGEMDEHVRNSSARHMEIFLKEIQRSRKEQLDQAASHSAEIRRLHGIIQTLQNEVRGTAPWTNQAISELKKSQEKTEHSQDQLTQQMQSLETNFKSHQVAFQTFKLDCNVRHGKMSVAKQTPPLKFVVWNVKELIRNGEGHESLPFYTECRGHQLKLKIFPGGKNGTEGHYVSVWLYRINSNYSLPSEHLPDQLKLYVSLELVNQLPMANEAKENHAVQLDGIVRKNQIAVEEETLISEKNNFVSIGELDHRRRDTFSLTARFTQYKKNDRLIFLVKSATEASM